MHHGFGEEVRWRSLRTAENPYGGFHLPAQWKGYWRPVFDSDAGETLQNEELSHRPGVRAKICIEPNT
jgi:hypothetical protein